MKPKSDELNEMFETASLGAPENAIGFVLWRMFHQYQREIDRALAPLELTHLQFTVLTLIAWAARSGKDVSQVELSRSSEIHKMQLSHILKTLEQKGWIIRAASELDVRAKTMELTRTGLTRIRKGLPIVIEAQRRLFGEGGLPEGELLGTFLTVLRRMEDESNPGKHELGTAPH